MIPSKISTYLSIDAGHKIGIVQMRIEESEVPIGDLRDLEITSLLLDTAGDARVNDFVIDKVLGESNVLVIERIPEHGDSFTLAQYIWLCNQWEQRHGGNIFTYSPGTWKPVAKARNWKRPDELRGKSKHEYDAFNTLRYHLWSKGKLLCKSSK